MQVKNNMFNWLNEILVFDRRKSDISETLKLHSMLLFNAALPIGTALIISRNETVDDKTRQKAFLFETKIIRRWIGRLQAGHVSLIPSVSESCDGAFYTFTYIDDGARMNMHWHNHAASGAEVLDRFTDWLWSRIPAGWVDEVS